MSSYLLSPAFLRILFFTLFYFLFFAWTLSTIAKKQGLQNSWFAWVPFLNLVLMGRCAGFGAGLIFLLFIPILNILVGIYCWYKITKRMSKPGWYLILLFIPFVNLVYLYLVAGGEYIDAEQAKYSSAQSTTHASAPLDQCPNCDAEVDAEDKYCGECGHFLGAIPKASTYSSSGTSIGGIAAAVLVVIVLGAGGYYTYNFFSKPNANLADSSTPPRSEMALGNQYTEPGDDIARHQRQLDENRVLGTSPSEGLNSQNREDLTDKLNETEQINNPGILSLGGLGSGDDQGPPGEGVEITSGSFDDDQIPQELLDELKESLEEEGLDGENLDPKIFSLGDPGSEQEEPERTARPIGEVFKVVEQMPLFSDCGDKACSDRKLRAFIEDNLMYPDRAYQRGVEGTVIVQFIIDQDGLVSQVRVIRGIDEDLNEEAMDLAYMTMEEGWKPGRQRGKPVAVQYNLPIRFEL